MCMKKCFKMKEILDFYVLWKFHAIGTCLGNISKLKNVFPLLVFINMFQLSLWNLKKTIFFQITKAFCAMWLKFCINCINISVKREMREPFPIKETMTMLPSNHPFARNLRMTSKTVIFYFNEIVKITVVETGISM